MRAYAVEDKRLEEQIEQLHDQQVAPVTSAALRRMIDAGSFVSAWEDADLTDRREIVRILLSVTVHRATSRGRVFDYGRIEIDPSPFLLEAWSRQLDDGEKSDVLQVDDDPDFEPRSTLPTRKSRSRPCSRQRLMTGRHSSSGGSRVRDHRWLAGSLRCCRRTAATTVARTSVRTSARGRMVEPLDLNLVYDHGTSVVPSNVKAICSTYREAHTYMSNLGPFVWSIADQLRGVYKPHQYGSIVLPFTILRRLDALMASSRDEMRALAKKHTGGVLDAQMRRATGLSFYNTSQYDFDRLLKDPDQLRENLIEYVTSFSSNIDVFEQFGFEQVINVLDENNRLYLVVEKFAGVNLHPKAITNAEMGDLYEHLIYKFAEASNEEAGEHYTPRDAIRLMVDLLFAEEQESLTGEGVVRTVYDPTAGTGGMLSVAEERLHERNPSARLTLYGQEINGQSYAICKSDMISKGQDIGNIRKGDTLIEDKFYRRTFDFCLSNPPYGVDWKAAEEFVKEEARTGGLGRFNAGLPPVSDGQMLFLQHLVAKMRPAHEGGGRAAIVLNGSPLFTGGAESGPSKIRQWLLEEDLVDAIIALPTDMFFNTGIATYVWILDNDKQPERLGTVQLIDASGMWTKMRKGMGSKRREISIAQRDEIVGIYDAHEDVEHSKILPTSEFGYWTITVERPLVDDDGEIVRDRKGKPKPDSKKRDTENVPFTYGGNSYGADGKDATIEKYFEAEVAPHVPDAWIDHKKTKVGYEIPFTRIFYTYVPPRPLEEIDKDLEAKVAKILTLLKAVEA